MNPLSPTDLGLILSYHCLARCAHCVYNCGPERLGWMSPVDVQQAMQATTHWNHPYQVNITGGEPFLNFPLLLTAVEDAAELEIPVYLETNAGWCVREELVVERFRVLRLAGLEAVLISCSPFHTETIPLQRTQLAVQTAVDIFGPQRVILYMQEWMQMLIQFGQEDVLPLEDFISIYGEETAGKMFWQGYGLMGGGRCGVRLGHLVEGTPTAEFEGADCRQELLYAPHSHFDLHGNFVPGFCGGISVGSWRELPELTERFSRGEYPPLTKILVEQGPYGLAQLASEEGFEPREHGYADKCHLCVDVRRWIVERRAFPEFSAELQPAAFYSAF
ncbi:MAG: hypothetical protein JXA25_06710 [Anaerolineales bacterium]|nr:hypothetical protein [Anaerolineales bacterium]